MNGTRAIFLTYLLIIALGLAWITVAGVLHR
jgi:hypothetical protein